MKKLTLLFLLIGITKLTFSQSIKDVQIRVNPTGPFVEIDTIYMDNQEAVDSIFNNFYQTADFIVQTAVLVNSTDSIAKVHIKMGRTIGGSDIFNSHFTYDNFMPGGAKTYSRKNNLMVLGLGNYTNLNEVHVEITIEYTSGQLSEVFVKSIYP